METYSATCMSKGGDHLSLTAHQFPPPPSPQRKKKKKKSSTVIWPLGARPTNKTELTRDKSFFFIFKVTVCNHQQQFFLSN